jgi:hypothetical protein
MVYSALIVYIRETTLRILLKDSDTPKHPQECFLHAPCGCSNPGQEIQCEDCPYLEACLSRFKIISSMRSNIKAHR